MQFRLGNYMVHSQIIPLYGIFCGIIYYNPNLEPDEEPVDDEDLYHTITFAFFVLGIHINLWKL